MTLGSGCGNKTLIRLGAGNLKSLLVLAAIAVFLLVYARNARAGGLIS